MAFVPSGWVCLAVATLTQTISESVGKCPEASASPGQLALPALLPGAGPLGHLAWITERWRLESLGQTDEAAVQERGFFTAVAIRRGTPNFSYERGL